MYHKVGDECVGRNYIKSTQHRNNKRCVIRKVIGRKFALIRGESSPRHLYLYVVEWVDGWRPHNVDPSALIVVPHVHLAKYLNPEQKAWAKYKTVQLITELDVTCSPFMMHKDLLLRDILHSLQVGYRPASMCEAWLERNLFRVSLSPRRYTLLLGPKAATYMRKAKSFVATTDSLRAVNGYSFIGWFDDMELYQCKDRDIIGSNHVMIIRRREFVYGNGIPISVQ